MGALEPLETIPILLRSGVDPDLKDRLGRTPLDLASQYKLSEDVLDALKDIPMDAEGIASYCENIRERHPLIRSRYSDSQEEEKNELFVEKVSRGHVRQPDDIQLTRVTISDLIYSIPGSRHGHVSSRSENYASSRRLRR
jgi:hypothetical protein